MAQEVMGRLRSEAEYERAVDEIERYFDNEPAPGTTDAARFDELARLIEEYENAHWPIEASDADTRTPAKGPGSRVMNAKVGRSIKERRGGTRD